VLHSGSDSPRDVRMTPLRVVGYDCGRVSTATSPADPDSADPQPTTSAVSPQVSHQVSQQYVRDRALQLIASNTLVAALMIPAFITMARILLRDKVDRDWLDMWTAVGVVATVFTIASVLVGRRHQSDVHPPRSLHTVLVLMFLSIGVFFGLSTWVGTTGSTETAILLTTFPAIAAALAVVVTAARLDMLIVNAVPLFALAIAGLFAAGDSTLTALGYFAVMFALLTPMLHHIVSRSLRTSIALQGNSEALLRRAAEDRNNLAEANARLEETNRQLAHLAYHDPLTGLLNRRGALERLDEMLAGGQPVSALFCDLDRFKAINDLLGHRGGDRFLSVLADRIERSVEREGFAGRLGGDEFIIVLPGVDQAAAGAVASRLVGVLAQPVHAEGRECPSSVSIGVASAPVHGNTSSELLRNANAALYRAKTSGRNRVELFDGDMRQELSDRVTHEQALRRALDDNQIMAFFQPEIDATNGAIVGAELLARWVRPDGRIVPAAEFIELARQAGMVERLTEQVVGGARRNIRRLASLGLPTGFRFRLNVSSDHGERVWHDKTIDMITHGIEPSLLTVDVREGAVNDNMVSAAAALAAFRARGGRVCLDDFGRGVASLGTLRRLPLDEVRIDRLALDTITSHPHDRAIIRSVIALVRELGLTVTADGVETAAQADALIALGCVLHQGHLYAPALMADEFEAFLMARLAEQYGRSPAGDGWDSSALH
jgi:diguanylate cyclase (GGDEF)-like protein